MADIIFGIIFLVVFYFVFKLIWNNVTTVSYSGLEGFFKSWGNQIFWAFIITAIIMTIAAKIMESITSFGRGLDFGLFDILCYGIGAYVIFAVFFSSENAFDRKTFRENYNRNVTELSEKIGLNKFTYIADGNPGNLINIDDKREGNPLSLAEEFVTNGSSELIQFPSMWINHSVSKDGIYTSIKLSLKHLTCDDEMGRAGIAYMEKNIAEITFTAAIEAVAKGKGRAIENALSLINEHGAFGFLGYACDAGKTASRNYTEGGIEYIVSRNSNGNVSLKMLKKTSEGK
ncbi:MAG: hypothetical protein IJK81_02245 [Selenomonadaceae bacterium]|nr:hypothetical protein [Selenomonadaceae bacterium]